MKVAFLFLTVFCMGAYAQNFPFPQQVNFPNTIKPNNVTQAQMNQAVAAFYDNWKRNYLTPGQFIPNTFYVAGGNTGGSLSDKGTSEGHGWGMIITALMAGYDDSAQIYFDGLYRMFDATRSTINPNLMGWLITANEDGRNSSAADGDMDIAYALILAHHQWGSDGDINYIQQATTMITEGINVDIINSESRRIMLGDWDNNPLTTRSSDWMPGHLRAYYHVTGENILLEAVDEIYSMIQSITTNFSPSTGLMPDFVAGETPAPAAPNFLESEYDGDFYYNACRFPLRIVADFAHHSTPEARDAVNNILNWLKPSTNNNPLLVRAGYRLNGEPIHTFSDISFTAPLIAAAIADATHQEWLNDGWEVISTRSSSYYPDTINLLSMLLISGNWWAPPSAIFAGQFRLVTDVEPLGGGAIVRTPASLFYEGGTIVELTALPAAGFEFSAWSGDIDGTINPITVTINAETTVVAVFVPSIGSDITMIDDCEDGTITTLWQGSWYSFSNPATTTNPAPFAMSTPGYNSQYAAMVSFNLEQGDYQWLPYAGMGFSITSPEHAHNLGASSGIGFHYRSTHALSFRVELSTVIDYAHYAVALPVSNEWRFAFFEWGNFSQPNWGTRVDFNLEAATNFSWYIENQSGASGELWVDNIFVQGEAGMPVSVKKKVESIEAVELKVYPNPFNPIATINVSIPIQMDAQLKVFDIAGRLVKDFNVKNLEKGVHPFLFDGTMFTSGIYLVRFTHGDKNLDEKMILLK